MGGLSAYTNSIISELREKKISYEEYLKKMADLAKRVSNTHRDDLPKTIQTPAQRSLYNNLDKDEELTIACDAAVRYTKQVDFRGDERKENLIKFELYKILKDEKETERIFAIIKEQREY